MKKYQAQKVVGQGSYGKAILCTRLVDKKKCIIKQISVAKLSKKEAALTEQEAALLRRLQHPNIVTFWESFLENKNLHIVMEFADGGDLEGYIKQHKKQSGGRKQIDEAKVLNMFIQLSLAIKHIHDRKILHRDLKSQNVFLTSSGMLKLGDFGVSKVLRNTVELAATQIGTPYYMSPEIMKNQRYNSKTDIWSLGCILYELMCLKLPFDGNSMKQLCYNIANANPAAPPSVYSSELKQLLKDVLNKNPKIRPGVNSILSRPIIRGRIANFLGETRLHTEFSHTVLHGANLLKNPGPISGAPAVSVPKSIPEVKNPIIPSSDRNENKNEISKYEARQKAPPPSIGAAAVKNMLDKRDQQKEIEQMRAIQQRRIQLKQQKDEQDKISAAVKAAEEKRKKDIQQLMAFKQQMDRVNQEREKKKMEEKQAQQRMEREKAERERRAIAKAKEVERKAKDQEARIARQKAAQEYEKQKEEKERKEREQQQEALQRKLLKRREEREKHLNQLQKDKEDRIAVAAAAALNPKKMNKKPSEKPPFQFKTPDEEENEIVKPTPAYIRQKPKVGPPPGESPMMLRGNKFEPQAGRPHSAAKTPKTPRKDSDSDSVASEARARKMKDLNQAMNQAQEVLNMFQKPPSHNKPPLNRVNSMPDSNEIVKKLSEAPKPSKIPYSEVKKPEITPAREKRRLSFENGFSFSKLQNEMGELKGKVNQWQKEGLRSPRAPAAYPSIEDLDIKFTKPENKPPIEPKKKIEQKPKIESKKPKNPAPVSKNKPVGFGNLDGGPSVGDSSVASVGSKQNKGKMLPKKPRKSVEPAPSPAELLEKRKEVRSKHQQGFRAFLKDQKKRANENKPDIFCISLDSESGEHQMTSESIEEAFMAKVPVPAIPLSPIKNPVKNPLKPSNPLNKAPLKAPLGFQIDKNEIKSESIDFLELPTVPFKNPILDPNDPKMEPKYPNLEPPNLLDLETEPEVYFLGQSFVRQVALPEKNEKIDEQAALEYTLMLQQMQEILKLPTVNPVKKRPGFNDTSKRDLSGINELLELDCPGIVHYSPMEDDVLEAECDDVLLEEGEAVEDDDEFGESDEERELLKQQQENGFFIPDGLDEASMFGLNAEEDVEEIDPEFGNDKEEYDEMENQLLKIGKDNENLEDELLLYASLGGKEAENLRNQVLSLTQQLKLESKNKTENETENENSDLMEDFDDEQAEKNYLNQKQDEKVLKATDELFKKSNKIPTDRQNSLEITQSRQVKHDNYQITDDIEGMSREKMLRMTELREYLGSKLGQTELTRVLTHLADATDDDVDDEILLNKIENIIGPECLHYLNDVYELLSLSDSY